MNLRLANLKDAKILSEYRYLQLLEEEINFRWKPLFLSILMKPF